MLLNINQNVARVFASVNIYICFATFILKKLNFAFALEIMLTY